MPKKSWNLFIELHNLCMPMHKMHLILVCHCSKSAQKQKCPFQVFNNCEHGVCHFPSVFIGSLMKLVTLILTSLALSKSFVSLILEIWEIRWVWTLETKQTYCSWPSFLPHSLSAAATGGICSKVGGENVLPENKIRVWICPASNAKLPG